MGQPDSRTVTSLELGNGRLAAPLHPGPEKQWLVVLGGGATDYSSDSVAIGVFAGMEQNVLVSCSAGNVGPGSSTHSVMAPWITTVGAGILDRDFLALQQQERKPLHAQDAHAGEGRW
jgi:hypothetical protein